MSSIPVAPAGATPRHFLVLADRTPSELLALLDRASALKAARRARREERPLAGRTLGLLMEKPSTRTRVSFEAAMFQLGGLAIDLPSRESQLGRGETVEDTARTLSRYVDALVVRTFQHERLEAIARAATIPVLNGLTDTAHPVQVLADLMTVRERLQTVAGRTVVFLGDGASNMALSWAEAAGLLGFRLRLAAPPGYRPEKVPPGVEIVDDPAEAARGADVLCTDVWTSMGQEEEAAKRRRNLARYQLDARLVELAAPHAFVMHCLPAHRGEEITAEVIDGPRSAVFDEAENRLHVQKALLEDVLR